MINRHDRVIRALNQMLPPDHTWEERDDAAWREAFPCGIAPLFKHSLTLTVCSDQIVKAGAALDDDRFESFLDALVDWVFISGTPLILGESTEHVMTLFADMEPDGSTILTAVARLHELSLVDFLGVNRREFS